MRNWIVHIIGVSSTCKKKRKQTTHMKTSENTIKTLQTKDVFVDIYTDHFDESFYGFVRNFNDDFLLLEHYNDDSFYNGIIVFRREDITRIKWDNNDINSAFKLVTRQENINELISEINIESIESIIKSIDKTFKHVNLQIQNINSHWSIIGQIQEIDAETIIIKEFGTKSALDRGMLMLSTPDITRVDADGIYENNLLKIHNENKCS